MKLSQFITSINSVQEFTIQLPNGTFVPPHFHITEMGLLTKKIIDCGNVVREEKVITFQVWFAGDLEHRLTSEKVHKIIRASEKLFENADFELEVEYQDTQTIGKFGIEFQNGIFYLTSKQTTCLAQDHCGIPADKMEPVTGEWKPKETPCCSPNTSCC
ncbi:DUF6428 family protein [Flavobacterium sp. 20NA77.7]|uniref:DUF6428 family protein n=1 Tax=Flavobacterium nakdongensis TaxID=3073563 RepID=A0ABY9R7F1_9FLAO|nr:DUF6428 family protein [Flavobacterium sp. 20NA77.7]WMW77197.1 DUF6428 family protein [Flavobacterium sp. 20NA77.7]